MPVILHRLDEPQRIAEFQCDSWLFAEIVEGSVGTSEVFKSKIIETDATISVGIDRVGEVRANGSCSKSCLKSRFEVMMNWDVWFHNISGDFISSIIPLTR
jgi:hypothetical protein